MSRGKERRVSQPNGNKPPALAVVRRAFALTIIYDPEHNPNLAPVNVLPLGAGANIYDVAAALQMALGTIQRQIGAIEAQRQVEKQIADLGNHDAETASRGGDDVRAERT